MRKRAGLWFALAAVGALMLVGAPSALAGPQSDPPPADMCPPGFFVATIAGAVSCQPAPREPLPVVTVEPVGVTDAEVTGEITPAPVEPAPEPVEPAPAPVPPVQSVCD